jgi:hypothetical protein
VAAARSPPVPAAPDQAAAPAPASVPPPVDKPPVKKPPVKAPAKPVTDQTKPAQTQPRSGPATGSPKPAPAGKANVTAGTRPPRPAGGQAAGVPKPTLVGKANVTAGTRPPGAGDAADTQGAGPPGPKVQLDADELTTRIQRSIGIWETSRGKNDPAPRESDLDTVAGIHASMATVEQATMPYAITALKRYKTLRDKASPPLTMKELNDAEARVTAVLTLLNRVNTASARGTAADDFIAANGAFIGTTGLTDDDVRTMFRAVKLKSTLKKARTDMDTAEQNARAKAAGEKKTAKEQASAAQAARQNALKAALDAIPTADRLGLGNAASGVTSTSPRIGVRTGPHGSARRSPTCRTVSVPASRRWRCPIAAEPSPPS